MGLQKLAGITPQKQYYIDYIALGGAVMSDDGEFIPTAATEIATQLGISRNALYKWRVAIPKFWELVEQRRDELYSQAVVPQIYRAMRNKAVIQGDVQAAKLILNQVGQLKSERQEIAHSGSIAIETVSYGAPIEGQLVQGALDASTN
jgi:transposase-like protein